ncbi:MAG: CBS domain-containing protein [bacterium]
MQHQLDTLMHKIRAIANSFQTELALVGILPTIRKSDLDLHNLTPKGRYRALNDAIMNMRGGAYELNIKGTDELHINHDSVMLEAANASFQIHFQVSPHEFARLYNIAQVATAPVLAAAVNSPLLFGKRLWQETRIVVFQQAIDTRTSSTFPRDLMPRVNFGTQWVQASVLEIFKEDISRFRAIVGNVVDENAFETLQDGHIPFLKALQLFNGTVYRGNRPCYGITNDRPHLRIENRALPAGPTLADEIANAAFWFGLISGMAIEYKDITKVMLFDDAKINFFAAARLGLNAQFLWLDGEIIPAQKLILEQLLPLAHKGLKDGGIKPEDIDRYLGIIEARVSSGHSGANWVLDSYRRLRSHVSTDEALTAITAALVENQHNGRPVHEWSQAEKSPTRIWKSSYKTVEQIMSTDLLTVGPQEPIVLAASLMIWKSIRHLPVEDNQNKLVGIITYRSLVRLLLPNRFSTKNQSMPVEKIMVKDPITVSPETPIVKASEIMREKQIGCLPVIRNGRLVGLLTEQDLALISVQLLEETLQE